MIELLKSGAIVIEDGAMGTMLLEMGLAPGECPEEWNEKHPEKVASVARAYLDAGSDVVLANTFGGSRVKLAKFGLAEKAGAFNELGARIASEEAHKEGKFAAGSVGPTGELLGPLFGTLKEADARAAFAEQVKALAAGGVDAIQVETMVALEEALATVKAATDSCDLPVLCTMSFEREQRPDGLRYRTVMGVSPEKAAEALAEAGCAAVGANCGGVTIADMAEIARLMGEASGLPVIVKPNAGLPKIEGETTVFPQSPEEMAQEAPAARVAGANIIGGCCGSTPEHIRALAAALKG